MKTLPFGFSKIYRTMEYYSTMTLPQTFRHGDWWHEVCLFLFQPIHSGQKWQMCQFPVPAFEYLKMN